MGDSDDAASSSSVEEEEKKGSSMWSRAMQRVLPKLGVSEETGSGMVNTFDFLRMMLGDVPLRPFDLSASMQTLWTWQQRERRTQLLMRLKALEAANAPSVAAAGGGDSTAVNDSKNSTAGQASKVFLEPEVVNASADSAEDDGFVVAMATDHTDKTDDQPAGKSEVERPEGNEIPKLAAEALVNVPVCLVMRTGAVVGLKNIELVESALFWCKLACAAYGWKLLFGFRRLREIYSKGNLRELGVGAFRKKFKQTDAENIRILCLHSGLLESDLLATKWTSETAYDTGHFVAIVQNRKTIAVVIRGTFHARDALTDMNAKYSPFLSGDAHEGILEAARRKRREIEPIVMQALERYPDYKVVVTGHSLGAGTASLLTMMWADAETFHAPIECHAFACPPVLSLDLAALGWTKELITSYVANDDIIPRLSYGSMMELKQWIVALAKDDTGFFHRSFQLMSLGNNLGLGVTTWFEKHFKWTTDFDTAVRRAYQSVQYTERLYLPGRVYFLYQQQESCNLVNSAARSNTEIPSKKTADSASAAVEVDAAGDDRMLDVEGPERLTCDYAMMEESSAALFEDLVLSPSMFADHMPDLYEEALVLVLHSLQDRKKREDECAANSDRLDASLDQVTSSVVSLSDCIDSESLMSDETHENDKMDADAS